MIRNFLFNLRFLIIKISLHPNLLSFPNLPNFPINILFLPWSNKFLISHHHGLNSNLLYPSKLETNIIDELEVLIFLLL
jgi:hypothetical protein